MKMKCLHCGKESEALWCCIACKEAFYLKYFGGSIMVKNLEKCLKIKQQVNRVEELRKFEVWKSSNPNKGVVAYLQSLGEFKEKKTLSDKVVYTSQVTVKESAETNFVSKEIYEPCKDHHMSQELFLVEDVKQALKEFVEYISITATPTPNAIKKAKEIFGDKLIENVD